MKAGILRLAVGSGLAALAVGCATYETASDNGRGVQFAGADRLRDAAPSEPAPHVEIDNPASFAAGLPPVSQVMLAEYSGIDGARRAHRLYTEVDAERLDGACERFVKIAQGETIADIARLCDVPVPTLVGYNPAIKNAERGFVGQIVEIPPSASGRASVAMSGIAGAWYVVQPGDTLQTIADRHLVSASAIANLNPDINWKIAPAGAKVKLPAAPGASTAPPATPAPRAGAYAPPDDERPAAYGANASDVSAQMPYRQRPVGSVPSGPSQKPTMLSVDRMTAPPGASVKVSGSGLEPNAEVSLYRGPNGGKLEFVRTVKTDSSGSFSEPVAVRSSDGLGGVIFKATVEGETLMSPRVGVTTLDPK